MNAAARQMYERAIELDPKYAEAYTGLAMTYLLEWVFQWNQDPQTLEQAFALAQKSIALDDSLPAAHTLLGQVYVWKKQHEQAIAEGKRAVALDPNNADAYEQLGQMLIWAGRPEEALGSIEKAMHLNPRSPAHYFNSLGWSSLLTGRYEEAITALKNAFSRNPNFLYAHLALAVVYSELGREAEARAEATAALRLNPHFSLEVTRQRLPFKDPAVSERFLAALRKAGLK